MKRKMRPGVTAVALAAVVAASLAACSTDSGATDTIRIGWVSMDDGQLPLPGVTDGAMAAAKYVNANGGINGRDIELVLCSVDTTPEKNQLCGQKLANEPNLNLAMMGISLAAGPFYDALKPTGLPVVGLAPITPADYNAQENVRFLYSGGAGLHVGLARVVELVKPKRIAYLVLDNAAGQSGFQEFKKEVDDPDVEIKSIGVSATATDVLPELQQVGAKTADLVIVAIPNCLPFAKGLQSIGAKGAVAATGSCFNAATIGSSPELFEGWYDPTYVRNPLEGTGVDKVMDTFLAEYPKHAKLSTKPIATYAEVGWGGILTLRDALEGTTAADLGDPKRIQKVLTAYTGAPVLGPTSALDCSASFPNRPSLCTLDVVIEQVRDGKLVPLR